MEIKMVNVVKCHWKVRKMKSVKRVSDLTTARSLISPRTESAE